MALFMWQQGEEAIAKVQNKQNSDFCPQQRLKGNQVLHCNQRSPVECFCGRYFIGKDDFDDFSCWIALLVTETHCISSSRHFELGLKQAVSNC